VTADLEALLTALYVLINDHVIPSGERGPARPKKLSGAELACLAAGAGPVGRPVGAPLAADVLRPGRGTCSPYLPKQPGHHRCLGRHRAGRAVRPAL